MHVVTDFTGAKARHLKSAFSTATQSQSNNNNDLNGCPCSEKPTMIHYFL